MPRTQKFFTRFHDRRRRVIHRGLRGAFRGSPRLRMNNSRNRIRRRDAAGEGTQGSERTAQPRRATGTRLQPRRSPGVGWRGWFGWRYRRARSKARVAPTPAKAGVDGSGTELRYTGEVPSPVSGAGAVGPPPRICPPVTTVNSGHCHHESGKPDACAWAKSAPEATFQTRT